MKKFMFITVILLCVGCASPLMTKEQMMQEAKYDFEDSPFGVLEFLHWSHDWNDYKYPDDRTLHKAVNTMKAAGVKWVRFDFLWQDIEPKQGEFNFEKYDRIVQIVTAHHINILGLLDYSASWASDSGAWNSAPKDNKLFVNYAKKVISHYKNKIKYWEVWNEPDSPVYWKPQDGLKSYVQLLKETYIAAKEIDPDCKILNGGLANGPSSVNKLYDAGAKDYFDILNIHIFESPLNPGSDKRMQAYPKLTYKIMKRNGDADKKIWVTETGCPGVKAGLKVKNWWLGSNPNEREQAEWVKNVYTSLLKEEPVEKVFWAFFRDTYKHWNDGTDYLGIMRWDFTIKPAFKAYRKCVENWRKGKL